MLDRLTAFACDFKLGETPPKVIDQALRGLVDWLGVTLKGRHEPAAVIAAQTMRVLGGEPQASLLGSREKTSLFNAALVNGTSGHVLDFDDTHLDGLGLPASTPTPPLMRCSACAKPRHSAPRMCRVFNAAYPSSVLMRLA